MYQNHVIDPTFFYDAIEEFSFNYTIYIATGKNLDYSGKLITSFEKNIIRGSLQPQGVSLNQSKDGNTTTANYKFYCKSLYRINIGDIIEYKDKYLYCNEIEEYDEFGVRSASLEAIQLTSHRDLYEYIKYLKGDILV